MVIDQEAEVAVAVVAEVQVAVVAAEEEVVVEADNELLFTESDQPKDHQPFEEDSTMLALPLEERIYCCWKSPQ